MCTSRFSSCACAEKMAHESAASSREKRIESSSFQLPQMVLNFSAFQQRLGDGAGVDVFQLVAQRNAARDATRLDAARAQHLGDVMRGGLAFVREVGGEDHFAH